MMTADLHLSNAHGHLHFHCPSPRVYTPTYNPWHDIILTHNNIYIPHHSPLNGPCTVALYNITGSNITTRRLSRYCDKIGARFIKYEEDEGIWTFWVKGFSRYGFVDSSDSDSESESENGGKEGGFEGPGLKGVVVAPELSDEEEDEEEEEGEEVEEEEEEMEEEETEEERARGEGMELEEKDGMGFGEDGTGPRFDEGQELDRRGRGWGYGLRSQIGPELHRLHMAMFPERAELSGKGMIGVREKAEDVEKDEMLEDRWAKMEKDEVRDEVMASTVPTEKMIESRVTEIPCVGLDQSIVWGRNILDMEPHPELIFGRAWRVGFGGEIMVWSSRWRGTVRYSRWVVGGSSREVHERAARIHFGAWREVEDGLRSKQRPGLQKVLSRAGRETRAVVLETYVKLLEVERKECLGMEEAEAVFRLVLALHAEKGERHHGVIWRVSEFLRNFGCQIKGMSRAKSDTDEQSSPLREVLNLVIRGDVKEAAVLAARRGHPRLALIVARALEGRKEGFWYLMDKVRAVEVRDPDERRILDLLSGKVREVAEELNLSWYKRLAMQLFYGKARLGSEEMMEEEYEELVEEDYTDPRWLKKAIAEVGTSGCRGEGQQAAAAVASMYKGREDVVSGVYSSMRGIDPRHAAASDGVASSAKPFRRSARLAWHLVQILEGLGYRASGSRGSFGVAMEYADELLRIGAPLWAFYVMRASGMSEHALRNFLVRNWKAVLDDEIVIDGVAEPQMNGVVRRPDSFVLERRKVAVGAVTFLTSELGIDPFWIHFAEFAHAQAAGNTRAAFLAASKSPLPDSAHAVNAAVMKYFVRAVCTRSKDALFLLLSQLASSEALTSHPHYALMFAYLSSIRRPKEFTLGKARQACQQLQTYSQGARTLEERRAQEIMGNVIAARAQVAYLWEDEGKNLSDNDMMVLTQWAEYAVSKRMAAEREAALDRGANDVRRFVCAIPDYAPFL